MRREFVPAIYLMASQRNGTTYLGVTSNLLRRVAQLLQRVAQHRAGIVDGFTRQHGVKRLVWFERHATMEQATLREKRVKKWRRAWKLELIEADNPGWRDLAEDFGFAPLPSPGFPRSRE